MGMMKVIAVQDVENGSPLEAVLWPDRHPERGLIHWWGGYASEHLEAAITADVIATKWPGWKLHNADLPDDWEEGYLRATGGQVQFAYGKASDVPL